MREMIRNTLPSEERKSARTIIAVQAAPTSEKGRISHRIPLTFADDAGRKAHLAGQIAAALMAKAPELLAAAPQIEPVDILAAKI